MKTRNMLRDHAVAWGMQKQRTAVAVAASLAVAAIPYLRHTPDHAQVQVAMGSAAPAFAKPMPPAAVHPEASRATVEPAWDLPNLDHQRVDYWVQVFTTEKRNEFALFLERMETYDTMITEKLRARGMPSDLIYLAMIESGFNPTARSHAAAVGLWQFIADTGRRYGLTINGRVDERKDPEKSTDAALAYLSDLYDRFGSWYLAAAAYNTGENRVARIMRELTGSERGSEQSYYTIARRLPKETRDYVPLMIAAARIAKEPAKYGFGERT